MTAVTGQRARRRSAVPGWYTRAEVELDLGLSRTELDTFERAGIVGPSRRRERGDTRPVLYDHFDLARARVAMSAHRFGIRGEQLRKVTDRLTDKRNRMGPGWRGYVVFEAGGDLDLVPQGGSLDSLLSQFSSPQSVIALWVEVPHDETSGVGA